MKDFAPVARIGSYVFMLVVGKDVPAKTLPELVAYAKANPGKLTYASGNTTGIVAGETFKQQSRRRHSARPLQEHAAGDQRRARWADLDDRSSIWRRASSMCASETSAHSR